MTCLFCDIATGTIPVKKIYEDEQVLAFNDINPQAPTHILIIPKQHIENLNAVGADDTHLLGQLLLTVNNLAKQLHLSNDGYRVVINTNQHGGQTVFHLHVHLLGGRHLTWPPG